MPLLSGDSTSQKSLIMAQSWLKACVEQHERCPHATKAELPARVLDVGAHVQDRIKLKSTSGEQGTYACLSHCWGQSKTLTLIEGNHDELHKNIAWSSLQKTYTDAIVLCRLLGIRYLWIDSLCIVQDSSDDWKRESARMHLYYDNCYVCVAATAAADHDGGCRVRDFSLKHEGRDPDGQPYRVYVRPDVPHIMYPKHFPHRRYFPLLTRAWVYQERLLSPRVLHVTDMELFFECNTTAVCECGRSAYETTRGDRAWTKAKQSYFATRDDISTLPTGPFRTEHEWRSWVHSYSSLNLTKQTDRLPVLSGLAQVTRCHRETAGVPTGYYLAGLWEGTLVNELAWVVGLDLRAGFEPHETDVFPQEESEPGRTPLVGQPEEPRDMLVIPLLDSSSPRPSPTALPKPTGYIGPSWSWASVADRVNYAPFGYPTALCDVLGAYVEPEAWEAGAEAYYGRLTAAWLILRSKLRCCRWARRGHGRAVLLDTERTPPLWGLFGDKGMLWWRDWADGPAASLDEGEELWMMPLAARTVLGRTDSAEFRVPLAFGIHVTETVYLVLRLVDGRANPAVYERVGLASHSGMSGAPDFGDLEESELKPI